MDTRGSYVDVVGGDEYEYDGLVYDGLEHDGPQDAWKRHDEIVKSAAADPKKAEEKPAPKEAEPKKPAAKKG